MICVCVSKQTINKPNFGHTGNQDDTIVLRYHLGYNHGTPLFSIRVTKQSRNCFWDYNFGIKVEFKNDGFLKIQSQMYKTESSLISYLQLYFAAATITLIPNWSSL